MKANKVFLLAGVLVSVFAASGDTLTWKRGGNTFRWSDPDNWSSDGTHTIPQIGDSVIASVDLNGAATNDIEGLSLAHLTLQYHATVDHSGTTTRYADFHGKKITLTGGPNAFKCEYTGKKCSKAYDRLRCSIPFELADGTQTFDTTDFRLHQSGVISGAGALHIKGANYTSLKGANTYSGGTVLDTGSQSRSTYVDASAPTEGKAGTPYGAAEGLVKITSSVVLQRLYFRPCPYTFRLENQTARGIASHTFQLMFNQTFNGAFSGDGLTIDVNSTTDNTFNQPVLLTGPLRFFDVHELSRGCTLTFNGRVEATSLNQGYDNYARRHLPIDFVFNAPNNALGEVFLNCENLKAGAPGALGTNTVLRVGFADDARGIFDCNGYDQCIDRILLNPSHPITNATQTAHKVTSSSAPARLTLASTADCETDAFFADQLTLVWQPREAYTFKTCATLSRQMTMRGALVVSNGTFEVNGGNAFAFATKLEVADDATFNYVSTALNGLRDVKSVVLGERAHVHLPEGMVVRAASLEVGGQSLPDGTYAAAQAPGVTALAQLSGGGIITVDAGSEATWTGAGGADTRSLLADNWSTAGVPNFLSGGLCAIFASGGTRADFADDLYLDTLAFDAPGDFTLAQAPSREVVLSAGLTAATTEDAPRRYTLDAPLTLAGEQQWTVASNTCLVLAQGVKEDTSLLTRISGYGALELTGENVLHGTYTNGLSSLLLTNAVLSGAGTWSVFSNCTVVFANAHLHKPFHVLNNYIAAAGRTQGLLTFRAYTTNSFNSKLSISYNTYMKLAYGSHLTIQGPLSASARYVWLDGLGEVHLKTSNLGGMHCLATANGASLYVWEKTQGLPNYLDIQRGTTLFLKTEDAMAYSPLYLRGMLDLGGCDQTMGRLSWASEGPNARIHSDTPATLKLRHDNVSGSNSNRGMARYRGEITGYVSLAKTGDQNLHFERTLAATGSVSVAEGCLVFTNDAANAVGSWPGATCATASGTGTIEIQHSAALGRETDVRIAGGGKLKLAAGVAQCVRFLYFDDETERRPYGTYGSSQSAAMFKDDTRFAGKGVLSVLGYGLGTRLIFK